MQLDSSKRSSSIIKSLLWNTIIYVFQEEKGVDITGYLVSVTNNEDLFFIKTNNPLINQELLFLDEHIKRLFLTKLKKVGFSIKNVEIKYI